MDRVRRIVLGISSGIAAYKMPQLIRLFQKQDIEVTAVLSPNSRTLVGEEALRVISKNQVYTDDMPMSHDMAHIELAKWADRLLVCPATANTIAKLAGGIADNLLTTLALSFEGRLIIAPAMNTLMWKNKATQDNIEKLAKRGATILPVDCGELACGDSGEGRLLELESIVDFVVATPMMRSLQGKKVLISSGPTAEPIDAVRVITNRSSGKMGAALAKSAMLLGAEVVVVSGPSRSPLPSGCKIIPVTTALEMKKALEQEFDQSDICIMAAAVGDFRPKEVITGKKHRNNDPTFTIECIANPDIAASLGAKKTKQFLVGFSLDSDVHDNRAVNKMRDKNCDMMVSNAIDSSLETDTTRMTILLKTNEVESIDTCKKSDAAFIILNRIARCLEKQK